MNREIETCIDYCQPGYAYISSNERKWFTRIKKLSEARSDECEILKTPDDNGGFVYARFPQEWVRIRPPKSMNLSDEERKERAERLRDLRTRANITKSEAKTARKLPDV